MRYRLLPCPDDLPQNVIATTVGIIMLFLHFCSSLISFQDPALAATVAFSFEILADGRHQHSETVSYFIFPTCVANVYTTGKHCIFL